jgi:hypothetical protein
MWIFNKISIRKRSWIGSLLDFIVIFVTYIYFKTFIVGVYHLTYNSKTKNVLNYLDWEFVKQNCVCVEQTVRACNSIPWRQSTNSATILNIIAILTIFQISSSMYLDIILRYLHTLATVESEFPNRARKFKFLNQVQLCRLNLKATKIHLLFGVLWLLYVEPCSQNWGRPLLLFGDAEFMQIAITFFLCHVAFYVWFITMSNTMFLKAGRHTQWYNHSRVQNVIKSYALFIIK